jgi:hypothetical protein
VLERCPELGFLVRDAKEPRERLAVAPGSIGAWAMSLTGAELVCFPTWPPPHADGDREQAVHHSQHGQDRSVLDLPQAQRLLAQPGDRARHPSRPPRQHRLPTTRESRPRGPGKRRGALVDAHRSVHRYLNGPKPERSLVTRPDSRIGSGSGCAVRRLAGPAKLGRRISASLADDRFESPRLGSR